MTPSRPAVTVPIRTPIREVLSLRLATSMAALHACRTALHRRKSDAHVLTLYPEFFLLIPAEIYGQQHTAPTRPAARDAYVGKVVVPGVGTEILLELVESIIPARRGVGAAEQRVCALIVPGLQQCVELLDPALFPIVVKNEEECTAN